MLEFEQLHPRVITPDTIIVAVTLSDEAFRLNILDTLTSYHRYTGYTPFGVVSDGAFRLLVNPLLNESALRNGPKGPMEGVYTLFY